MPARWCLHGCSGGYNALEMPSQFSWTSENINMETTNSASYIVGTETAIMHKAIHTAHARYVDPLPSGDIDGRAQLKLTTINSN